ncbi:MAG TPA: hypothetical protein VKB80_03235 [Kofleriaceae bacterium]|nr:hypothetical protein [Kofleriaceae bacterium]
MAETTTVVLKVVTHAGDLGVDGTIGDTVTVAADVAVRWIAAGIAEAAGGAAAEEEEKPANATPTSRRSR